MLYDGSDQFLEQTDKNEMLCSKKPVKAMHLFKSLWSLNLWTNITSDIHNQHPTNAAQRTLKDTEKSTNKVFIEYLYTYVLIVCCCFYSTENLFSAWILTASPGSLILKHIKINMCQCHSVAPLNYLKTGL